MNSLTLEIRPAAGGREAEIFTKDLARMYTRFAEKKGWTVVRKNPHTFTYRIEGDHAYEQLRYESGVHRVQRIPKTESYGRIHTSTATVAILPEIPPTAVTIRPDDLIFEAYRASGHGGQNVNKVATAVRLTHKPSGIVVTSQSERHQGQNKEIALQKLRTILWEKQQEKRLGKTRSMRSTQVGSGDRAEKIRTYNFPQDRITDHRVNKSFYRIEHIMDGNLEPILKRLHSPVGASPRVT